MAQFSRPSLKTVLLAATMLAAPVIAIAPTAAKADLSISVGLAPPPLPVYEQPPIPAPGYMWTPGYWAYANDVGYYWVPGTWIEPPVVGVLWTPPYWGWDNGAYLFHAGYWGPHVGFYGGIDYGFGYGGRGYDGGRWDHGHFAYNRTVNNFGATHVTNVYTRNVTVVNRTRTSFAGGTGGVHVRATAAEMRATHETHTAVTAEQTRHFDAAAHNPAFAAKTNNGHPAVAATARPAQFEGAGVTHERAARGPQAARPADQRAAAPAVQPQAQQRAAAPAPHPMAAQPPQARPAVQAATPHAGPTARPAVQAERPAQPGAEPHVAAHRPPTQRPAVEQRAAQHPEGQHMQMQRPPAQHMAAPQARPAAPQARQAAPAHAPAAEEHKDEKK